MLLIILAAILLIPVLLYVLARVLVFVYAATVRPEDLP